MGKNTLCAIEHFKLYNAFVQYSKRFLFCLTVEIIAVTGEKWKSISKSNECRSFCTATEYSISGYADYYVNNRGSLFNGFKASGTRLFMFRLLEVQSIYHAHVHLFEAK